MFSVCKNVICLYVLRCAMWLGVTDAYHAYPYAYQTNFDLFREIYIRETLHLHLTAINSDTRYSKS